ncbi:hypothetical protein [Caulobacter sp.]|uniref:hypothetical protein n=1 Tax=Caulobacter sp. TaxID=78 RepID=UPI003BB1A7DF
MQKQRIVEVEYVEDPIVVSSAPLERSRLRLANESDVSVVGPARRLQNDLAQAFAAEAGWSVKRTVMVGLIFHAVILGSLALAASNLIPHIKP